MPRVSLWATRVSIYTDAPTPRKRNAPRGNTPGPRHFIMTSVHRVDIRDASEQVRMRGVEECARDAELGGGCKARLAAAQHNGPAGGAPASHESLAFSVHHFSNQAHGAVVCNVTRGCIGAAASSPRGCMTAWGCRRTDWRCAATDRG